MGTFNFKEIFKRAGPPTVEDQAPKERRSGRASTCSSCGATLKTSLTFCPGCLTSY